jgi:predicted DNA-binding transcriptional regulator AlpA
MATHIGELWRLPKLEQECGCKKSAIYAWERQGKFPKRIKIGRASAWNSVEVQAWKLAMSKGQKWSPGHA